MRITPLENLPEVIVVDLDRHSDQRGWFMELWNPDRMNSAELRAVFVQDNLVRSACGVLRGLHYQAPHPQGKLVNVIEGEIFDVAVDVRPASPTFGGWVSVLLKPGRSIYVPEGFAHGYQVVSDAATVLYKCTDHYRPECDHTIAWDDPHLAISWPIADPILSEKDRSAPPFEWSVARTQAAMPDRM